MFSSEAHLSIDEVEMERELRANHRVFQLAQGGSQESVYLKDIQYDTVTDQVLHVDLMEIPRGQDVTVAVQVEVVGTNDAIKTGEGSVAMSLSQIDLSCRPSQRQPAYALRQ